MDVDHVVLIFRPTACACRTEQSSDGSTSDEKRNTDTVQALWHSVLDNCVGGKEISGMRAVWSTILSGEKRLRSAGAGLYHWKLRVPRRDELEENLGMSSLSSSCTTQQRKPVRCNNIGWRAISPAYAMDVVRAEHEKIHLTLSLYLKCAFATNWNCSQRNGAFTKKGTKHTIVRSFWRLGTTWL